MSDEVGRINVRADVDASGVSEALDKEVSPALKRAQNQAASAAKALQDLTEKTDIYSRTTKSLGKQVSDQGLKSEAALDAEAAALDKVIDLRDRYAEQVAETGAESRKAIALKKQLTTAEGQHERALSRAVIAMDRLKETSRDYNESVLADQKKAEKAIADASERVTELLQKVLEQRREDADKARKAEAEADQKAKDDAEKRQKSHDDKIAAGEAAARAKSRKELNKYWEDRIRMWLEAEREFKASVRRMEDEQRRADAKARNDALFNQLSEYGRKVGNVSMMAQHTGMLAAIPVIANLTSVVSGLSGVIGTLPGVFAAAGTGAGVFNLATMGLEDTIGALVDGDMDKFAEQMEKLPAGAQRAALAIEGLIPGFNDLRSLASEGLFANFEFNIDSLAGEFGDDVAKVVSGVGDSMSDMFSRAVTELVSPETAGRIANIVDDIIAGFETLEPAVAPVAEMITIFLESSADMLPRVAQFVVDLAERWAGMIRSAQESGKLEEWMDRGLNMLPQLIGLVEHLATEFFGLGESGEAAFPAVIRSIEIFADVLFFAADALTRINAVGGQVIDLVMFPMEIGLKALSATWDAVTEAIQYMWNNSYPVLNQMLEMVNKIYEPVRRIAGLAGIELPEMGEFGAIDITSDRGGYGGGGGSFDQTRNPFTAGPKIGIGGLGAGANNRAGAGRGLQLGSMFERGWNPQRENAMANADKPDQKSESELLEEIEAGLDPSLWQVDVWGETGSPNITGGALSVNIDNIGDLSSAWGNLPGMSPGGGAGGIALPSNPTTADSWRGTVAQVVEQYGPAMGISQEVYPAWIDAIVKQIATETGGDPTKDNPNDSNGRGGTQHVKGLLQYLDSTYAATGGKLTGLPIGDPIGQIAGALFAQRDAFGRPVGVGFDHGWGPDTGMAIPFPDLLPKAPPTGGPGLPMMPIPSGTGGAGVNLMGADERFRWIAEVAKTQFGLDLTSGMNGREGETGSFHSTGDAGDFAIPGTNVPTPNKRAFAEWAAQNLGPFIEELIYTDDQGGVNLLDGKPFTYSAGTQADHRNHVHLALKEALDGINAAALGPGDSPYARNMPYGMGPDGLGYFQVDQQDVMREYNDLINKKEALEAATRKMLALDQASFATEQQRMEARQDQQRKQREFDLAQMDYAEAQRGDWQNADIFKDSMSIAQAFPDLGQRFMANFLKEWGAEDGFIANVVGAPFGGRGNPRGLPTIGAPALAQEGNPLAAAALAGIPVLDYSPQAGGQQSPIMRNDGPPTLPNGQVIGDTSSLVDRTLTDTEKENKARHEQQMDVLSETAKLLGQDALIPTLTEGVSQGMTDLTGLMMGGDVGSSMGAAAGPIIGADVASAMAPVVQAMQQAATSPGPAAPPAGGGNPLNFGGVFDEGGDWAPGTYGINTSGMTEHVLTGPDAALFKSGLLGGWNLQPQQQHFARGDVTDTVGADFFGVGEIPIIGTLVNLLVNLFLKIIGVEIEARDTLIDMASDVRQFRGDFETFDATGRIANDTSGLIDRNQTSKDLVNAERVRILTQVIVGTIKFIIEKVVMPMINAAINAAISFGQQALSMAVNAGVNTVAPGAGGIAGGIAGAVSGAAGQMASALAQVLTDIIGTVLTEGLGLIAETLLGALPEMLFGIFDIPNLLGTIFGPIGALFGGLAGAVGGVFGGLFDEGGIARGKGLMVKDTIKPEEVLSPSMTPVFRDAMGWLKANGAPTSTVTRTDKREINVPITMYGDNNAGRVRDTILELL